MAEDLPSREILEQLVERLDLLERLLAANTTRLHAIERRLGIVNQRPLGLEPLAGQSGQQPARSQIKAEDSKASESTQPPTPSPIPPPSSASSSSPIPPRPVVPPAAESPAHTWSMPEASETRATHPWMNETTKETGATKEPGAPPSNTIRESETPGPHVPLGKPLPTNEWVRAETVREPTPRDLESMVGGRWFNWIGIIAVTIGVAFFLKFAFDQHWVGPSGRISVSALVGVTLLYVGERLRNSGLKAYAYVLSGGGILILYLACFAAYNFYHLIGQPLAFVLMAVVTTTAVLLSVRLDALPVAILGLIGGFLTPVLLSTGVDNEIALFTYVALLDAGVLALAYFKSWRSLDFLSFAGTVAMTLGWGFKFFEPGKVWLTLVFLSIFFLLYALLAIFHNVLPGRPSRWFDVALTIANATFYFGISYLMLGEAGFDLTTPATQALLVSVFFTGLFYTTWRWSPDDRLLRYSYVGAATTFLTMAVAIQLELHWVTIVWAVEALMLTWVGLRSGEKAARHASLAVFCVAVVHWFFWDMREFAYGVDPSFVPLLNRRALSSAVLVGAIAAAAWLYRRSDQLELDENERETVKTFLALTGNAVALTLLSLDLNAYFTARLSQHAASQLLARGPIENTKQFSISTLWTLYAATMLALGVVRRFALLRWGGLLLLLAAVGKVIAIDTGFYAAWWHLPVFNLTFLTYALLVAALVFAAWFYGRLPVADDSDERLVRPVLVAGANVLAVAALSLEVLGYYDRWLSSATIQAAGSEIFRQVEEGRIFALVLVWTIYATGAFLVGAWRRSREWRWGGLLLLALTSPFVLLTLINYDAPWHTLVFNRTFAAFAMLVTALWIVARTYGRSGEAFEETSTARRVVIVVANLLAIVGLSAQAAGYYDAKIAEAFRMVAQSSSDLTKSIRDLELAKQLSLSVIWGLYASGMLIAGQLRRLRMLRVMALALLSLTTVKVFIWDLSSLDRVYRIISFIMLGAILLLVSYFYQRSQQRAEEESEGGDQ